MGEKVWIVVTPTGTIIITDSDAAVVLMSGHLIFTRKNQPCGGYAPARWIEFVEVTDPAMRARLRAQAEGGAGSA